MALPVSTLARVCRSIAELVRKELQASQNNIRVMIGSPSEAAPKEGDNDHRLNLFFYRFEPGGFGPGPAADEPWLLRMCCLVTPFGVLEERVSAGENDLRLLGEVIRVFHEKPVLDAVQVDGQQVRTQVVFQPLSAEEINHLWSTQGEVSYRPSVAYEMALVPIIPSQPGTGEPLAGALGFEVRTTAGRTSPFAGVAAPPPVAFTRVDTGREDWAPRVCFVEGGACAESLAFAVGSPALAAFRPRVWVAGEVGSAVGLTWEIWDPAQGWRPHGTPMKATITDPAIDPEAAAGATTTGVVLPFADHAGQALLYAVRTYARGSDGAQLTVRSNPLLVTLYEVRP